MKNFVLIQSFCRFVLTGMLTTLGQNLTVVRVKPWRGSDELVSDRGADQQDLVAVGTADGCIQLVDIVSGLVSRDFSVHSCAVRSVWPLFTSGFGRLSGSALRCLEWGGGHAVISSGYSQTLSTSTVVRNELFLTDTHTGAAAAR